MPKKRKAGSGLGPKSARARRAHQTLKDPETLAAHRERSRQGMKRRREDPNHREEEQERRREGMRQIRQNPQYQAKEQESRREGMQLLRRDSEYQEKENERKRESMQQLRDDPQYKEQEKQRNRESMQQLRDDPQYKEQEKQRNRESMQQLRDDPEYKEQEKEPRREAMKQLRQNPTYKEQENRRKKSAMQQMRKRHDYRIKERTKKKKIEQLRHLDPTKKATDQSRKRCAMKRRRQDPEKRIADLEKNKKAMQERRHKDRAPKRPRIGQSIENHSDVGRMDIVDDDEEPAAKLRRIHQAYWEHVNEDDFTYDLFRNNPLIDAGRIMYEDIEKIEMQTCDNCQEHWPFLDLDKKGLCCRCHGKRYRELFSPENNVTPSAAPHCLDILSPIEKSAISRICPSIAVFKKGSSTATRGHAIHFHQDVQQLATTLPRLPAELPYIVLKNPRETNDDKTFLASRLNILNALQYLKEHNHYYRDIEISEENLSAYPENGIVQNLPEVDPDDLNIPPEAPSAANEESARDESSTVDDTDQEATVIDSIRKALLLQHQSEEKSDSVNWPQRSSELASEYCPGFFSMAFPDLFPDGKGDLNTPRRGKEPTKIEYFGHLLRVNRNFAKHHCFVFVATNMVRRHMAISLSNVYARKCASGLTNTELKALLEEGNAKVVNKLLHFTRSIPGTRQYLWSSADKALSFLKFVRISSKDSSMFTFFQTFSAADLHWDDLHRILPGSDVYLGKKVIPDSEFCHLSVEEQEHHIKKSEDYKLRMKAVNDNGDIVDMFFCRRLHHLLSTVMVKFGVKDYIIRYEVQARGTIHAHLLLRFVDGPSYGDLENALEEAAKNLKQLSSENREIRLAEITKSKNKVVEHSCLQLGVSALHPSPDPDNWPGPIGRNVYTPRENVLTQRFLECKDFKRRHELIVNRCMIHNCRIGYCLKKVQGELVCRFNFPFPLFGFRNTVSESGSLLRPERSPDAGENGGDFVNSNITYVRNHPTVVHHIPEILTIWNANIEGRTVKNYQQVLNYLLKYMMKEEPNSKPFASICQGLLSGSDDGDPVRKSFQRIVMRMIKEHDLSKQECHHILNGLEFVEFSRRIISVNVMGTRKIRQPTGEESDETDMAESNWASIYWMREEDQHYRKAIEEFNTGNIPTDPAQVSLYQFASEWSRKWQWQHGQQLVPHITPNFRRIPQKSDTSNEGKDRYLMFLRATLLTYKPGTTFTAIDSYDEQKLEMEMEAFCTSETCPVVVREEYEKSQRECPLENMEDPSFESESLAEELHIPVSDPNVAIQQDMWMSMLRPIPQEEVLFDAEADDIVDYNDNEFMDDTIDWSEDKGHLNLTDEDVAALPSWLEKTKAHYELQNDTNDDHGRTPANLNEKQRLAFNIVKNFVDSVIEQGLENTEQLLLNISGGAGTGKSYWLNTVRQYVFSKDTLPGGFLRSAAPSGTAAFLIGGVTLHKLLQLPIKSHDYKDLEGQRLADFQVEFENVGLIVIDEKSMIGQRVFYAIDQRLRQARPRQRDQPFGGISVVLLGDWKQLPPVCDSPLYQDPTLIKNTDGRRMATAAFTTYMSFKKAVIFTQVQRQVGEAQSQFREELCRLGEGQFTEDDWNRWKQRSLDHLGHEERDSFLHNATLACAMKKDMIQHNVMKVKSNQQPIALFKAIDHPKTTHDDDRDTDLQKKIILCRGAHVRLTRNLWVEAGLTNGATGVVHSIVYADNNHPPELPAAVIVVFDDYTGPGYRGIAGAVAICSKRSQWMRNGREHSRTMIPLILGYALSIHKLQGATLDKVILNLGPKEFSLGLALVGSSRVRSFEGLAFSPYPNYDRFLQIGRAKQLPKRITEEQRLQKLQDNTINLYQQAPRS